VNGQQILSNGTGYISEKVENDSIVKHYDNYLLQGKAVTYTFSEGNYKISSEENYDKGQCHGERKYYNNSGSNDKERLSTLCHLYRGKFHGYYLNFYDGKITERTYFIHGKEHGITKHFDEFTRQLTLIEPWIMGKRHGIRKYFNRDGIPELYQYFYDGETVGRIEFENGKITKTKIYEGDEEKFYKLHRK
jgi:antitoxin component YwqK of YwqJK toxin-antitoxin module